VARVWDSLLFEGSKVLLRVGLALVKQNQRKLLECRNPGDVLVVLKEAQGSAHDGKTLMDAAFNRIGPLPSAKLTKYRTRITQRTNEQASTSRRLFGK